MLGPFRSRSHAIAATAAAPGPNEAAADVMGLGFDQVVRLRGSRVEIVAPPSGGGVVLASFKAGTDATWPGCDRPFHGQDVLRAIGHEASRVSVVGGRIAVSLVRCAADLSTFPWSDGRGWSSVELYEPDGTFVTRRTFADGVAVTALTGSPLVTSHTWRSASAPRAYGCSEPTSPLCRITTRFPPTGDHRSGAETTGRWSWQPGSGERMTDEQR